MLGAQAPQTKPAPAVQTPSSVRQASKTTSQAYPASLVESGNSLFQRDCSFCHGREAGGGETGPDLTRSKVVANDKSGDQIGPVVRNGRTDKGMPRFTVSDTDLNALTAYIHTQKSKAEAQHGGRRGVDAEDLQTGDVEAGKRYFNGQGGCASCHSPTGDLAGVAQRFEGLKLEQRMLYPKGARSTVAVTLPSGQIVNGKLSYLDEFHVGRRGCGPVSPGR